MSFRPAAAALPEAETKVAQKRGRIVLVRIVYVVCLLVTLSTADLPGREIESSPSRMQQFKNWARDQVVRETDLQKFGLFLDDDWAKRDTSLPVVLLVHGFNSSPGGSDELLRPLRAAGFPCGAFAYPNDQALLDSSRLLSRELKRFANRHPGREVALVTHSMGGLVARACVEDPTLDVRLVKRLVMIAPPTHGTELARYAAGADLWEHGLGRQHGSLIERCRASVADGLAEALDDLEPGSEFLTRLNARPRNARIRYTVLLGTGGKVYQRELDLVIRAIRTGDKLSLTRKMSRSLAARCENLEEVVLGKGDGIVSVRRGYLPGVADTVVLPFGHLSVAGAPQSDVVRAVQQEVLKRLR